LKFEREVEKVREEHRAEIDELLSQLDLVEAEHNERYAEKEQSVSQKDAIIAALGAQLAEATAKTTAAESELERNLALLESTQQESLRVEQALREAEDLMITIRTDHERALEAEKAKREVACDQVKDEMITAAEEQFARANETFMKLKHEHDAAKTKLIKMEKELNTVKREADKLEKEQIAKEDEINADVAQLKAALASAEATVARKSQKYNSEIQQLRAVEDNLLSRVEEANTNCATAHMSLATVVAEKERLTKELEEMKSVCEELMAMIENGEQQ